MYTILMCSKILELHPKMYKIAIRYCKNTRKFRSVIFLTITSLIVVALLILKYSLQQVYLEKLMNKRFMVNFYAERPPQKKKIFYKGIAIAKTFQDKGDVQLEKYDEHSLKSRLFEEKINTLKNRTKLLVLNLEEEHFLVENLTTAIHIFYKSHVQWYMRRKPYLSKDVFYHLDAGYGNQTTKNLNIAFYPAMGLYKPSYEVFQKHFQNIHNCGVGVIILSYSGKSSELEIYKTIFQLASKFNISVTFEINVDGNQSLTNLQQQLKDIRTFYHFQEFFKVYSQTRKTSAPIIYINNAYKLEVSAASKAFCKSSGSIRYIFEAFYVGHIRLKSHADYMRRLCLDGFYSKLPSNGVTFASTWKNWSYLKLFALTYKMLFIPTVGPGFAERNKYSRQRNRSNGRYYGVAWRTAISNHVGFINIASYNSWTHGSQIEEVIPKAGFLDYSPGTKNKYLDLTAHWVGNFITARKEVLTSFLQRDNNDLICYEYLNNTIC